jgi:hypothetical protein
MNWMEEGETGAGETEKKLKAFIAVVTQEKKEHKSPNRLFFLTVVTAYSSLHLIFRECVHSPLIMLFAC